VLLLSLFGCGVVSNITFLNLTSVDEHFIVDVVMDGRDCIDVSALQESTLAGRPIDFMQDTRAYDEGTGQLQISEYGVWRDSGGCEGNLSFGFNEIGDLADQEFVTLELTSEIRSFEVELDNWPLARRGLIPETPLNLDTLWGSQVNFELEGPGVVDPYMEPRLYGPEDNEDLVGVDGGAFEIMDRSIQVTFPPTNPLWFGEPDTLHFAWVWALDAASPYSEVDPIGEGPFYVQIQTDTFVEVPIQSD
jgi:hypothetical protein